MTQQHPAFFIRRAVRPRRKTGWHGWLILHAAQTAPFELDMRPDWA